jgi:hypothetical protein
MVMIDATIEPATVAVFPEAMAELTCLSTPDESKQLTA